MDTARKLEILAEDARYDLSCACGSNDDDRRKRGRDGMWVYPASLPRGGKGIILKTLLSNRCVNDCRYCPLRADQDTRRCSLAPEEIANAFMAMRRQIDGIHGLFLTSGVVRDTEHTMGLMVATAELLRRRHGFRGVLHLKILPGASDGAIEAALAQATSVSLNVEAPSRSTFATLSARKDFDRDIVAPIKRISQLTAKGNRFEKVKQTTQFIVGAAGEIDRDIVRATFGLYRNLGLDRIYFSAYQRGLGQASLPGETANIDPHQLLTREHRLYQADFLLRKYKWNIDDIGFEADGNLSLAKDPKQTWAEKHPEFFPVRLRTASKDALLRVPGLGPTTASRIVKMRKNGTLRGLRDIGVRGKRLATISQYVTRD